MTIQSPQTFHTMFVVVQHEVAEDINRIFGADDFIPSSDHFFVMLLDGFKASRPIKKSSIMTEVRI
jgi:hypothetical protein